MNPQDQANQQTTFTAPPPTPSLLDRIVSEGRVGKRDELILKTAELDYKQRIARMFALSRCFSDVEKDDQGFVPEDVAIARAMIKIELGASMGFSEAESMSGIDIIKGRPAIGAHLRAARMKKAGFSWPQMTCTDLGCWIPLEFQGEPMMQQKVDAEGKPIEGPMVQVVVAYTKADAEKAGLFKKDNYQKNPSDMFFARGITRAQRRYGSEVLSLDILDTYEAREIADVPVSDIAAATTAKTDDLAGKLATKREQAKAAKETAKEESKPEPVKTGEDYQSINRAARAQGSEAPAVTVIAADPRDADWQTRVLTFKATLGEPEFLATLHSVTGSEDITSVTTANHVKVWDAMGKAAKKDGGETAGKKPGDLF